MSSFPIAEAQLVSLFMQSIAYGVHVVTFGMCLSTLLRTSHCYNKPINWQWLSVALILFVFGTADVSFNLYHNLIAFIFYTGPGGPSGQFSDISNWVNVMRTVWILLQSMVSDAALIYRCWVISDRKWQVIVLPSLTWLGATACGAAEAYYTATLESHSSIPDSNQLDPLIIAYCILTLVTNIFATSMIVYRIWKVDRQSSRVFGRDSARSSRINLSKINRVFIESAMLYTAAVLVTFILEVAGSNAFYGVSDVGLELAGVAFDLIIVRIGKGIAVGFPSSSDSDHSHITLRAIRTNTFGERIDEGSTVNVGKELAPSDVEEGSSLRKVHDVAFDHDRTFTDSIAIGVVSHSC